LPAIFITLFLIIQFYTLGAEEKLQLLINNSVLSPLPSNAITIGLWLQFDNGINIVTDYGHYNAWVDGGWDSPIYDFGELVPDVMTYSHTNHEDHYDPDRIPEGVKHIMMEYDTLSIEGIHIQPVRTCETSIQWYAKGYSNGVYYYRLNTDHFCEIKRMILAK
jgi:hypothetical protein